MSIIEHVRTQVRRELLQRYEAERIPVDARIEHRDGRVELVWFNGKRFTHDLDNYRWTAEMIGGPCRNTHSTTPQGHGALR